MARPRKPIDLQSKHNSKEDIEAQKQAEEKLKGDNDKIKPPKHLTSSQKKIFKYIVTELKACGILTNLDVYILADTCINLDRMNHIDTMVNKDVSLLSDRKLMSTRKDCESAFFRCCNELSLSPQSRAKLAGLNVQAQLNEEDPLLKIWGDDDD